MDFRRVLRDHVRTVSNDETVVVILASIAILLLIDTGEVDGTQMDVIVVPVISVRYGEVN